MRKAALFFGGGLGLMLLAGAVWGKEEPGSRQTFGQRIILIDPDIPVSEDLGPLPQIYPAPSTYTREPATTAYSPAPPATAAAIPPTARIEYAAPLPGKVRVPSAPRRVKPWVWGLASALLLVTLLAQTTYFLRDALVSRLPQTRPAFEQACAVLGCTLSLPKNLAQLQIVGSDLQTEASGRLKLTLTLGNRANHAQAWPVLVLTLTDQRNRESYEIFSERF